jgi:hypothetical protein
MKRHVCAAVAGTVILGSGFSPLSAGAQAGTLTAAVSGIAAVPIGPLIGNRGVGGGAAFGLRYAPASLPNVAMRLELSGLWPSSRVISSPADESAIVANGSSTLSLMAGPEFDVPIAGGHVYTTATAGAAHLWATSSASSAPTPAFGPFNTTTDRQATNFAWSGGGGFMTRRSSTGVAGVLAIQYYDLGRATYVTSYPAQYITFNNTTTAASSTVAHHRVTFLAPTIGLSWRP